jgi:hypothetical protein
MVMKWVNHLVFTGDNMSKNRAKGIEINIPIQLGENQVSFPNRCIVCGNLPTKARKLVVTRREEVGETQGLLENKTFVQSTARMLVPYCKDHYVTGWVDKWVLSGIKIAAFLIATNIIGYLVRDTFLVRGYWALLVVVVGLTVGLAFSNGMSLAVEKFISLRFPAISDVPADERGLVGGMSLFFSKSLLGIAADPQSLKLLVLVLHNPQVADKVRKLNTGTPDEKNQIEAWPETIEVPEAVPEARNKLSRTSMILGILSIPMAACLGSGALIGIAAVITGQKSRRQIREIGISKSDERKALLGIILGGLSILLSILLILAVVVNILISGN